MMKSLRPKMLRSLERGLDIETLISSMVDRRSDCWYDVIRLKKGDKVPRVIRMFSEPCGPAKGVLDTNMLLPNSFPPPYGMLTRRIFFVFAPSSAVSRFVSSTRARFFVLEKSFHSAPLCELAIVGNSVKAATEAAAGDFLDLQYVAERYGFSVEVYIPPLLTFGFELLTDTSYVLVDDIEMYAFIEGTIDHPVQ